ncbi:heavy metal-responsive transcriptional regulator [Trichothermofontia sichuanensis B231]|uniref:heavy metal-responsive transcriptional regulator n=1 Tax=Trichothermofontia sichuanensis TaxID=3045816 RepID=UPI002246C358|nr:heavy metal-responsive transcriptional regulator [Trichothermofontia sichuanensis]UZQ55693.1 heavy metal-responsive transcriptional regulator [Trichothermofontia sichuanensis B231]
MTIAAGLKIGEVAKQTGVGVGALRYYESLGLLQSERGDNGYRYYSLAAVQQVQFIKRAQALGFSLEEIGEILTVHQQGHTPCDLVQSLLQSKIEKIDAQIQEMLAFKAVLEDYRDRWQVGVPYSPNSHICPLIETVPL